MRGLWVDRPVGAAVSNWQKVIDVHGVECWEFLDLRALEADAPPRARWTVYAARGRAHRYNPSGLYWRGMRGGVVVRLRNRVRTWRSRASAFRVIAELARAEP